MRKRVEKERMVARAANADEKVDLSGQLATRSHCHVPPDGVANDDKALNTGVAEKYDAGFDECLLLCLYLTA